jgi:hypothetical protein
MSTIHILNYILCRNLFKGFDYRKWAILNIEGLLKKYKIQNGDFQAKTIYVLIFYTGLICVKIQSVHIKLRFMSLDGLKIRYKIL